MREFKCPSKQRILHRSQSPLSTEDMPRREHTKMIIIISNSGVRTRSQYVQMQKHLIHTLDRQQIKKTPCAPVWISALSYMLLGRPNTYKTDCHRNIYMGNMHITENRLTHSKLYSMYHPVTLCMMIYLANEMDLYCLRWPPPMMTLVAEVAN